MGYHLDFLKVAKDLNNRFNKNFIDQYNLLKANKNLIKHIYYSAVSKDGEKFMEIDDTFMYLFTS